MTIGTHLASLNLFREPDGSVQITVADSRGALNELSKLPCGELPPWRPIDYVEGLIVDAAMNIVARRPDLAPETFEDVWAKFEANGYQYGRDALENVKFGWKIAKGLEP
jgi:hypothetical protein